MKGHNNMKLISLFFLLLSACNYQSNNLTFYVQKSLNSVLPAIWNNSARGAGVVIGHGENTMILTANHVVHDGIQFRDGMTFGDNTFKVVCSSIEHDLALVKTDMPVKGLVHKSYIANYKFKAGTHVYMIGSPIGIVGNVTYGIISNYINYHDNEYYLTDADCTSGNSGGGLFTTDGVLVGTIVASIIHENWNSTMAVTNETIFKFIKKCQVSLN